MKSLMPIAILLLGLSPAAAAADTPAPAQQLAQSFYPAEDDDRPELFLPEEGDSDPENFEPEDGDSNADNFESPDLDDLALPGGAGESASA